MHLAPHLITRRAALLLCAAAAVRINAAAASDPASIATPTEILTGIYREAVKGTTADWLDPARRGRYLSKSLLALWARADAKTSPDGDGSLFDFDLATDTNGLELVSFRISPEKESATAATLSVALDYRKPYVRKDPAVVIYDFVREDGHWRIDEIRTRKWSVRDMLEHWLKQP